MNVLFVSSEVVPFAKTGGLADVVSALGAHMKKRGHDVRIVLPYYSSIRDTGVETETVLESMGVSMGPGIEIWCSVKQVIGTGGVQVLLIEHDGFFNREGLYHDNQFTDYGDNAKRFGFLARAALQVAIDTQFSPDIIHANDWQAALVAAYQKVWFWDNPIVGQAATVLTIHNARYQGNYPGDNYHWLGFGPEHFTPDKFEDYGDINMLKAGIYFADMVNTVSPTHAAELIRPYSDFGMEVALNNKGDSFLGILNGVDYDEWCPEKDPLIPQKFSVDDLSGKARCKEELQDAFLLEKRDTPPIIGIVGRMVEQKGYHLLIPVIETILATHDVQFVILGSGDKGMEDFFGALPERYPGKVGSWIGYSNEKAHLIEAGADMFLMPSIFEPCGLNQIYSLKYGTLPIVRAVGGLDDTVRNFDIQRNEGTGFKFWDATPEALQGTIEWALDIWYTHHTAFDWLRRCAMRENFSWEIATDHYVDFYHEAQLKRAEYNRSFQ
ncbi:glycogen synthase GlgA [Chitinivibrio alkaliphilus]|uniref:Glycogen synthase n=1 Tax=Chitinivibrio alkaliphilus ACht1 TaxID=1313304 RepID=U7DBK4_9BACT|nr:glycogen synthase GlgA [Chitinivibrio alkaliphilus]ERP31810.1 glycogen synthase [Chitinivibrio alkaliphilus ACht1]